MSHEQPLSPLARYEQDLQRTDFSRDAAQAAAVDALQTVYTQLQATPPRRWFRRQQWAHVDGLYMWGGVGRGKTYLMDTFFDSLPFARKLRTHFHRFMLDVHERRKRYPDEQDPLKLVAEEYAAEVRVLCFDEFYVSDIADAMILGRLFENLFRLGVTLVATSNIPPERLYENGLQRANFMPFIDILKRNVRVLNVDGGVDYRLRTLTHADIYRHPCDEAAEQDLERWFETMAHGPGHEQDLLIHDRIIHARRELDGVVWFDFDDLCEGPRGAADYIEIGRTHHTVLVSRVPQLTVFREDAARRFINLVDEFYDRGVKLLLAADVAAEDLYVGNRLKFEFQRTLSRLTEMQSEEYLARAHLT
ncbi:cell division protein ZapE [Solimonas marina]|uniref:Cell division protein ZapE n=1 Tax=Solimonas marina TaxID=2714601 RepID=A0A970B6N2_9GAMM|nr:cell division protein ZapE [Solimonas marina]NKF24667.1 cell division protein ZapE [Solimonas marina]